VEGGETNVPPGALVAVSEERCEQELERTPESSRQSSKNGRRRMSF